MEIDPSLEVLGLNVLKPKTSGAAPPRYKELGPCVAEWHIVNESHTLGNLLRCELSDHPHVVCAAYKVGEPLEHHCVIRVVTKEGYAPHEVMQEVVDGWVQKLDELRKEWARSK